MYQLNGVFRTIEKLVEMVRRAQGDKRPAEIDRKKRKKKIYSHFG